MSRWKSNPFAIAAGILLGSAGGMLACSVESRYDAYPAFWGSTLVVSAICLLLSKSYAVPICALPGLCSGLIVWILREDVTREHFLGPPLEWRIVPFGSGIGVAVASLFRIPHWIGRFRQRLADRIPPDPIETRFRRNPAYPVLIVALAVSTALVIAIFIGSLQLSARDKNAFQNLSQLMLGVAVVGAGLSAIVAAWGFVQRKRYRPQPSWQPIVLGIAFLFFGLLQIVITFATALRGVRFS
jgi:hypothetical protein